MPTRPDVLYRNNITKNENRIRSLFITVYISLGTRLWGIYTIIATKKKKDGKTIASD